MAKKKKSISRASKSINIQFNSWTFFIFALFVLLAVMIFVARQAGEGDFSDDPKIALTKVQDSVRLKQ